MRDQVLLVHANASVGDGKGLLLFVQLQINARSERKRLVSVVDKRQVAQLIERVGGIGNELAEKDLRMLIEGVDDQLQQLIDFGLEFTFRHGYKSPISNIKQEIRSRNSGSIYLAAPSDASVADPRR